MSALRYIDNETRQEILAAVHMTQQEEAVENILNGIPAVDVEPVVHAHWIVHEGLLIPTLHHRRLHYECSHCHMWLRDDRTRCGECGAKMDEE